MWPFKRKTTPKQQPFQPERKTPVPFSDDLSDPFVLRHHALRALCGALMDRHSECRSPHPFCGNITAHVTQLIANAVEQVSPYGPVLAIYTSKAVDNLEYTPGQPREPLDGAVSLEYAENIPGRKLVVNPNTDGTYTALYGPILDPVEGHYATGSIDGNAARTLNCNPEPQHTKWQYWERKLPGVDIVPEYRCLCVHGSWWIVEADRSHGLVQHVASLEVADNPEHNFGIHSRQHAMYVTDPWDDSEYAKVIRENLPRTM